MNELEQQLLGGAADIELAAEGPDIGVAWPGPMEEPGGSESNARRTVAWWRSVADLPLYDGCEMTVKQLSYVMLREKRQGRTRNNAIDRCHLAHDIMMAVRRGTFQSCSSRLFAAQSVSAEGTEALGHLQLFVESLPVTHEHCMVLEH